MTGDPSQPSPVAPDPLNVVLIGFMGCGKTTVGALLAQQLGFAFVDMDHLIVKKAGVSIPRIFQERGEAGFRALESEVLEELCQTTRRSVISTGGGVVTVPENLPRLRRLGYVIWFNLPEDVLFERISRNQDRPLLHTPDPRRTVSELLQKRLPLYSAAADLEADLTGLTPHEAAYGLAETVRVHFAGAPAEAEPPPLRP